MSDSNRAGCPVGLVVLGVVLAVAFGHHGGGAGLTADETQDVLNSLGIAWGRPGPPVVMFTNPG